MGGKKQDGDWEGDWKRDWDREYRLLLATVRSVGSGKGVRDLGATGMEMRRCAGMRRGIGRDMVVVGLGLRGYATVAEGGGSVAEKKTQEQTPRLDSEQGPAVGVENAERQQVIKEAGVRHERHGAETERHEQDVEHERVARLDSKQWKLEEKIKTVEQCRRDFKGLKPKLGKKELNLIEGYFGEYMRDEINIIELYVSLGNRKTRMEVWQDSDSEGGGWHVLYGFDKEDPKNKELLEEGLELDRRVRGGEEVLEKETAGEEDAESGSQLPVGEVKVASLEEEGARTERAESESQPPAAKRRGRPRGRK